MRRREFIGFIGAVALLPLSARAQQSTKVYRIAILHPSHPVAELTEVDTEDGHAVIAHERHVRRTLSSAGEPEAATAAPIDDRDGRFACRTPGYTLRVAPTWAD